MLEIHMKHYICAMILIVYLPGCTSFDMVSCNPRIGSLSYSQLNENSADESATIVFKNGQSILAKIVQIRPDSTFLVLDKSEFRKGLLTSEIHEISTKNHVTGAFEGLGLGSLVGVATVVIDLGFFSRADAGATILLGLAG